MHVKELFDLTNQTAIVTGGGTGIGKQIAFAFAEAGANVVICSRNVEVCQEISNQIKELGVKSLAIKCDVSNPEEINNVISETLKKFGKIDILVNNSGATWYAPALEMPVEKWDKVMDVNLKAVFLFSQAAAKLMVEQGSGKIINVASVAGFGGQNPEKMNTIGYTTSKGAVITFTQDLAVKLAQYNVHVNAIAPGFFPTKMAKTAENLLKDSAPIGRVGSDYDIKGAALFLASKASDYVIGHVLPVDGGVKAVVL